MNPASLPRILVAINTLEVGGAERQVLEICRALGGREFRFDVVTTAGEGPLTPELTKTGAVVHSLRIAGQNPGRASRLRRLCLSVLRSRSLLKRLQPDLIHAYLPEMSVVAAASRWPRRMPPLVLSKRSLVRWIARDPIYFPIARWANRRADVILANSEAVRREAVTAEGADARRVRVIHNGVDVERFRPGPPDETLLRELALPARLPIVGMVANFTGYKGHADVLDAAATLRGQGLDFALLFVGHGGGTSDAVRRQAHQTGLADRIRFAGSRQDVERLLRLFDVFVSASHEEGFSNAILEAMATARAVVATAVGGTVEQIQDGENGLLVASRDPRSLALRIGELLRDEELRRRLGAAARETVVRRFSLRRLAEETASLYRSMIRGESGAGGEKLRALLSTGPSD